MPQAWRHVPWAGLVGGVAGGYVGGVGDGLVMENGDAEAEARRFNANGIGDGLDGENINADALNAFGMIQVSPGQSCLTGTPSKYAVHIFYPGRLVIAGRF